MLTCADLPPGILAGLLGRFGLALSELGPSKPIPGSFWGEPEAGLIGSHLYVRADTPVHSALHEACHYICMAPARRGGLHTDAGGDYDEESAVCYLQILLAAHLPPLNPAGLMADMDAWGYSFRLGSTQAWFSQDADEARLWLQQQGLIDADQRPTWRLRY